jgi:hypothetical protein
MYDLQYLKQYKTSAYDSITALLAILANEKPKDFLFDRSA